MTIFPPESSALKNEADVEGLYLDPLLHMDCPVGLGLLPAEVRRKPSIRQFDIEKRTGKKVYYPDFVILAGGLPLVAVEAKPPEDSLDEAAREARLYATELNAEYPAGFNPCRYCLVSNGLETELRQWDSDDLLAKVTLEDSDPSHPDFAALIVVISADALRNLSKALLTEKRPKRFYRAGNMVGGSARRDEEIEFNNFGRCLSGKFQEIFDPSSIDHRLNVVQNAYVPSKRRERYLGEIDRVINLALPPSVQQAQLISDTSKPKELITAFSDEQLSDLRKKVLLLIGSVGSGKTTFVDYLENIALPDEIRERTAWVRLNINDAPVAENEVYGWCRKQLIEKIPETSSDIDCTSKDGLEKLFRKEIGEWKSGVGSFLEEGSEKYNEQLYELAKTLLADQEKHITALERHLATGRGRLLVVALDNCDKRDRDHQLLMFQVAKWLQDSVRCLVVLPLRDITYENYKDQPPLDTALKDLIFRIKPPPFQKVLTSRLNYLFKQMKEEGGELTYHAAGKEIRVNPDTLERFLRAVMNSLFSHDQVGRNIIVGLAGGNIRKAFDIFVDFCRSGYIREDEIFRQQATGGDTMPLQKGVIAKTLLRTNRRYYDGECSYIKNIFQIDHASDVAPDHLLRWRILKWLADNSQAVGDEGMKGYKQVGNLADALIIHGCDPLLVKREASYLYNSGCLVAEHLRDDELSMDDLVAITSAGRVHLTMVDDFHYLAACAEDTWVSDKDLAVNISDRMKKSLRYSQSWESILFAAGLFADYLAEQVDQSPGSGAAFAPIDADRIPPPDFVQIAQQVKTTHKNFEDRKRARGQSKKFHKRR